MRTLFVVVVGFGIVGGQLSLAAFARDLLPPWTIVNIVTQSLRNPWLYVAGITYFAAIILYLFMLRAAPIAATNLPVIGVVVILNILLAFAPGESMGLMRIGGALLIGVGILLIQVT
jgi:hypothetical protein